MRLESFSCSECPASQCNSVDLRAVLAPTRLSLLPRWAAFTICAAHAAVLLAGPAFAAPAVSPDVPAGFVDLNGDTRISYEEFAHSLALKAMRDLNADGSRPRIPPAASAPQGKDKPAPLNLSIDFSKLDADRDGRISLEEMKQAIRQNEATRKLFRRLDTDHNGSLDPSELEGLRTVPQVDIQF